MEAGLKQFAEDYTMFRGLLNHVRVNLRRWLVHACEFEGIKIRGRDPEKTENAREEAVTGRKKSLEMRVYRTSDSGASDSSVCRRVVG